MLLSVLSYLDLRVVIENVRPSREIPDVERHGPSSCPYLKWGMLPRRRGEQKIQVLQSYRDTQPNLG
jgi:hypothetical protein